MVKFKFIAKIDVKSELNVFGFNSLKSKQIEIFGKYQTKIKPDAFSKKLQNIFNKLN